MTRKIIGLLALGLSFGVSGAALAELKENAGQDRRSPFMQEYGRTLPPIGHIGFCRRFPGECTPAVALQHRTTMTEQMRKDLHLVNDIVNQMIEPVTDQDLYGTIEHWTYPDGKGDCEDYVLLKKRLLVERGWPASALLITVVRDENDQGHAILTARTAEGDFLLDNKRNEIMAWNESPYRFIKRQSHWDPQTWISLAGPAPRLAHRPAPTINR